MIAPRINMNISVVRAIHEQRIKPQVQHYRECGFEKL
jgi:hypothetical protein